MKRCGHCLRFLPSAEFYRRGDGTGLAAWCRSCTMHAAHHKPLPPYNPAPLTSALTNWRTP